MTAIDGEARRLGWRRRLRALAHLPGWRRLAFASGFLVVLLVVAAAVLHHSYRLASGRYLGIGEAAYAVLGLLVLNPAYPFPPDGASRTVFFVVPLAGLFLASQVIARLVQALLDRGRWEAAVASTYSDHVIVCGLGRVGYRVVRWLLDLGEDVVVVDLPVGDEGWHAQVRAWGVPIIVADARRTEILEQAGIARTSAVMPLTDDDLVNLSIATAARSLRADVRVVLRTFDDRLAANLQSGFDIHRAYSTSALAAPAFAAAATHAPVDYAFSYPSDGGDGAGHGEDGHDTLFTITKFTLVPDSSLVGRSIGDVEAAQSVVVLAHRTTGFEMHPPPDRVLADGDGIVVSASPEALDRLARLTPPTREMRRYLAGRWPIERAGAGGDGAVVEG